MRYKKTVRLILIFVIIVGGVGFFYSNVSQPPFIHITTGKGLDIYGNNNTYYSENILVAHPPQNTLERMKQNSFGLPTFGQSSSTFGARPIDIPIDADGIVKPNIGGMSVTYRYQ